MIKLLSPIIKSIKGNLIEIRPDAFTKLYCASGPYTRPLEILILDWTLQQLKGDYMEIGINQGGTAQNMCRNNPGKTIYGVDYLQGCTMHPSQKSEQPTGETVARLCRSEPNFVLYLENSWNLKLPDNIDMVFIDADHTYQGVKADTENILRQVRRGTVIFWHDYHNNLHPDYLAVNDYIDKEVAPRMNLWGFKETWLIAGITN